jgi:4-hydroxy-3-methylbut-2-enyl diphosphate reductase
MKIILAQHFGICFGVRDAIAQAEALAREAPLTILGELVHNPIVRKRLRASGAHEGSLDRLTAESQRVLITAHGVSDSRRAAWTAAGFDVRDGTCPLVQHAHRELKRLVKEGYHPVVVGQKGHVEVRGLTEDFPGSSVVNALSDLASLPKRQRYGVISQTTQPIDHVETLVAEIRRRHPGAEVRFVDTICKPTKERQAALRELMARTEVVVVVGGKESNNTRQLVRACVVAGRRAIHVEDADELRREDFAGISVAGLTAGTSTLPETVAAVFRRLTQFSSELREIKQTPNQEQSEV